MADIPTLFVPAASSLLPGLKFYYKLEDLTESSGTGLTLTNNNGVTFTAGKVNNAATFVHASNQFLSHTDNAAYQMGTGSFSIAGWGKTTFSPCLIQYGKVDSTHGPGYNLRMSGANMLGTISDGTNLAFKIHSATVNDGAWHFFVATFARGGNLSMYVDNGAAQTASIAAVTGSVNDTLSFGFDIGQDEAADSWDGQIDELGGWNRVLTSTEIGNLWNGGAGITYPFLGF